MATPYVTPVHGVAFSYDFLFDGSSDKEYNTSAPVTIFARARGSGMAFRYFNNLNGIGGYNIDGSYVGCAICLINGNGLFLNIESFC